MLASDGDGLGGAINATVAAGDPAVVVKTKWVICPLFISQGARRRAAPVTGEPSAPASGTTGITRAAVGHAPGPRPSVNFGAMAIGAFIGITCPIQPLHPIVSTFGLGK